MIRLTVRQFRLQAIATATVLGVMAVALAITGAHLAHLYDTQVVPCTAQPDCYPIRDAFLQHQQLLRHLLGPLLLAVPALLGSFWGAPLVARELETGTFRLAWTQSVTRTRWLLVKLAVFGLASVLVVGLLSLMVTWWLSPFDHMNPNRFGPGVFDARGIVPIGYAAFAFAVGVMAGVVWRRTVPAMATSLVAFLGARLALSVWVRPHLMAPAQLSLPIASGDGFSFSPSSTGVTFRVGSPQIPNAWMLSSRLADASGQPVSTATLSQFIQTNCPAINILPGSGNTTRAPAADRSALQSCVTQLSDSYHLAVTYQPANRYWTFQWYELALYLALALLVAGCCVWWVKRRLA